MVPVEREAVRDASPDAVAVLRAIGRVLLMQPRSLAWIPPVLWAATIALLSSFEQVVGGSMSLPEWLESLFQDMGHPAAYGLLALLMIPVLPRVEGSDGRWVRWTRARGAWIVGLCVAYGFTDELHQAYVPGRVASLFDLLSDAVGAACVVVVVDYLSRADATRRGVVRRLLLGLGACLLAAAFSSLASAILGTGLWPFPAPEIQSAPAIFTSR